MTPEELKEIATRHQVFLERLKTQESSSFALEIDNLEDQILGVLKDLEISNINEMSIREFRDLIRALSEISKELLGQATGKLTERLEEIGLYEAGFEQRAIESLDESIRLKEVAAGTIARAAKAKPVLGFEGSFIAEELSRFTAAETQVFANVVKRGYVQGQTVSQVVKEIKGTKAAKFVDGYTAKAKRNAQTLVHTSVQHYSQVGREETWKRNADVVQQYEFVATLDSRTTHQCRALDGRKFDLGQGPTPPLHRRCRSTTVPSLGSEYDFLNEDATRSAQFGPVDAETTYYEWLKKQSPEFQDEALGGRWAKLFRDGGLSPTKFAQLSLDRNFQPITLEQMQKLEPLAFKRAGLLQPNT